MDCCSNDGIKYAACACGIEALGPVRSRSPCRSSGTPGSGSKGTFSAGSTGRSPVAATPKAKVTAEQQRHARVCSPQLAHVTLKQGAALSQQPDPSNHCVLQALEPGSIRRLTQGRPAQMPASAFKRRTALSASLSGPTPIRSALTWTSMASGTGRLDHAGQCVLSSWPALTPLLVTRAGSCDVPSCQHHVQGSSLERP